jgi:DNA-binding response OmpR family regulator
VTTILVVDDEPQIAEIASDYLRLAGFEVIVAADGVRALEQVRGRRPDLIILDLAFDRAIDSHVKNVRRKLREHGARESIESVYGIGYRFVDE